MSDLRTDIVTLIANADEPAKARYLVQQMSPYFRGVIDRGEPLCGIDPWLTIAHSRSPRRAARILRSSRTWNEYFGYTGKEYRVVRDGHTE